MQIYSFFLVIIDLVIIDRYTQHVIIGLFCCHKKFTVIYILYIFINGKRVDSEGVLFDVTVIDGYHFGYPNFGV